MVARCRTSHATFELIPVDLESIRIGSLYHAGKLQTIQINSRPHIYLCRIQGMIYRIPTLIQRNLIQITNVLPVARDPYYNYSCSRSGLF